MENGLLVGVAIIFVIIVLCQVRFWRRAHSARDRIRAEAQSWIHAPPTDEPNEPDQSTGAADPELFSRIKSDIRTRVLAGAQPDWQTYAQWLERFVRAQLEIIRQQANSALVLGILGTIGIAVFEILMVTVDSDVQWNNQLRAGILLTLGSSALGMLNNLTISQFSLRLGEQESDDFLDEAEDILRSFANTMLGPSLPDDAVLAEPINRLSAQVQVLGTGLEGQTKAIADLLIDQRSLVEQSQESYGKHTDKIAGALQQHSVQLSSLFEELKELPGMIRGAIETVPSLLAEEVRKGHRHTEEIRDVLVAGSDGIHQEIRAGHEQLAQSAKANQDALVGHLQNHVDTLDRAVREARLEVGEIGDLLESHTGRLAEVLKVGLDEMRRNFVSNSDAIVKDIFSEHEQRSRELVWNPLEKLGKELGIVSSEVPSAADRFRESVAGAAEKLAELPDDFGAIHDRLHEIEHKLTRHQDEFVETLASVEQSTDRISQNAARLHRQIGDSVKGLITLIRHLVNEIN